MSAISFGSINGATSARSKRTRRALIVRRERARARKSDASTATQRKAYQDRMHRGLDPVDKTLEHAGNPDHEIDQLPDSLLEDS